MDLGPHAAFIWLSYALVAGTIGALLVWIMFDGRRQRAALRDLEERGVTRRSSAHSQASQTPGSRP